MDFELSEDEQSLADGMRRLCEARFPLEAVRGQEGRRTLDGAGWRELAEAGVFALTVPEDEGGLGLGRAHLVVVFEELGRALVPGPLAATAAAAAVVKGATDGAVPVGLVRRPAGDSRPLLVGDLGSLGALLALGTDGAAHIDPADLDAEPLERPLDPLTPMWRVTQLPRGVVVPAPVEGLWQDFALATAAQLVGIAAATLDLAVAYARDRVQFGKPIGSFQAVKHLCADMLVRAETARNAVHAAAVTVDQPEVGDAVRAVAGAALLAGEAALANAKTCIQVYGGMGFTWEVPAHLYLVRARVLGVSLGDGAALADTVARRL